MVLLVSLVVVIETPYRVGLADRSRMALSAPRWRLAWDEIDSVRRASEARENRLRRIRPRATEVDFVTHPLRQDKKVRNPSMINFEYERRRNQQPRIAHRRLELLTGSPNNRAQMISPGLPDPISNLTGWRPVGSSRVSTVANMSDKGRLGRTNPHGFR